MSFVDEIRRGAATKEGIQGWYACRTCGTPFKLKYERCPECGRTSIAPIEEVMHPEFTN